MRLALIAVPMVFLVGCVAPKPAPDMPDEVYFSLAKEWSVIHFCAQEGWMPLELAAIGKEGAQYRMWQWSYDPVRLNRHIQSVDKTGYTPTKSVCNSYALNYAAIKQQREFNAQLNAAEAARAGQAPKTTTCNRFGTMTTCNSY